MTSGADMDDELAALGPHDVVQNLIALGASREEILEASKGGAQALRALRSALLLYPGGELSAEQIAAFVDVSVEDMTAWWRTVGLSDPTMAGSRLGDVEVAVADNLAAGLRLLSRDDFFEFGIAFGTSMRQVAKAIMEMMHKTLMRDLASKSPSEEDVNETIASLAGQLVEFGTPAIMGLLRLHLVASVFESLESEGDERGVRTILFIDLVGFTSLAQRVDSGELSNVLSALEALSVSTALETGGRVVKFLGDGVMLSFHHPHEAIAAARKLVADHPALPVRRAGISTGAVLARQGDYFGPTVNLAARLAAAARPGEILADVVPDGIDSKPIGRVELKGFDAPVTAYRVSPID